MKCVWSGEGETRFTALNGVRRWIVIELNRGRGGLREIVIE